jgi:hypothetical protein
MAAPDIPHPATAPQTPQNSGELHHPTGSFFVSALAATLAASLAATVESLLSQRRVTIEREDRSMAFDAKRVVLDNIMVVGMSFFLSTTLPLLFYFFMVIAFC